MWLADQWNDYEVIDCSKKEKSSSAGEIIFSSAQIPR